MSLFKAHGLGNDYLVWESDAPLDAARVRALCDRHRGPGGDGVLEPVPTARADHGVRIWNPDGSVAEKSGNGLRILAWWLVAFRGAARDHTVDTGHDVVRCVVGPDGVAVAMGRARLDPSVPPVLVVGGEPLGVVALSVGNPHCVVFRDEVDLDRLPWRAWGRALEVHPAFPNRTNVQVARVTPTGLELRVWERGAGETSASGSSSCAVAAAAVRTGRRGPGRVAVAMPGGVLTVDVSPDLDLILEGPVAPVGRFELHPDWASGPPTAG